MHKSFLTKPYYVHSTKPIRLRMERTVSQTLRQTRGEGNTKRFKQNQRKTTNRTRSPHATLSSPHHLHNKQKDEKKKKTQTKKDKKKQSEKKNIQNKNTPNKQTNKGNIRKQKKTKQQTTIARKCKNKSIQKRPKKHQKQHSTSPINSHLSPYTIHISTSPSPSHSTSPTTTQTPKI